MPYRGRYQLGDFIPLTVLCKDANGVPTAPDLVPEARIFNPSGVSAGHFSIPPLDQYGTTGLFQLPLGAAGFFATVGNWKVVYTYKVGTYSGMDEDTFEVLPGGTTRGNVIAMTFYVRPDADWIVFQTDGFGIIGEDQIGQIVAGRNPRI